MGTGASKKPKVENKQLKPARSKLMAAVALAKPGTVPGLCPLLKIATLLQWFSVTSLIESFKLWVESEKGLYNEVLRPIKNPANLLARNNM